MDSLIQTELELGQISEGSAGNATAFHYFRNMAYGALGDD